MKYLIRKNGYYYRPNSCGYTSNLLEAGLYDKAEAMESQDMSSGEVKAIPLSDKIDTNIQYLNDEINNAMKMRDAILELQNN